MSEFYVYQLVDPRSDKPFYVGKGKGNRAWQHEKLVRAGKMMNVQKSAVITEIIQAGAEVKVQILSNHASEVDAYKQEALCIAKMGRDNLTNCNDGGYGPFSNPELTARLDSLRACAQAFEMLISMGDRTAWIRERNYSEVVGRMWHERISGLLEKIVSAVINKYGQQDVKDYLVIYGK